MSATLDAKDIIIIAEPIFISNFKKNNGISPTLEELRQYLVSRTPETLISILKSSEIATFNSVSSKDLRTAINLYIRKLRVW